MTSKTIAFLLLTLGLTAFQNLCCTIEDGSYTVIFSTKGIEQYELTVSKNSFIKTLNDSSIIKGEIQKQDCLIILRELQSEKTSLDNEIEKGLGLPAILVTKIKGNTIYFKTVRSGNLNVVLNEGKMKKIK